MSLLRALLEVALPPRCAACDALGAEPFCEGCALGIEPGGELMLAAEGAEVPVRALYDYGGALATALFRLKYDRLDALARPLGALLSPHVPAVDLVVPVPLGPRRLRQRGFNPARELARPLGARVDPFALTRPHDAPPQVGSSRAARRAQVDRAFVVAKRRAVSGRRVLLIDDVITTGATLTACAVALLGAGAHSVQALTLARAQLGADDVGRSS